MKLPIKLHQRLDSGTAIGRRRRWTAEAKPAAGPIYLRTETGGVQRDYCLSEQDRVSLLEAVPAAAPIVSFSDQDRCLLVPPTAFRRTVARTIARSFGETTRHIRARRDTAVFATPGQTEAANASRAAAEGARGRRLVTPVRASARFWPAEAEHQDYAERSPGRYEAYRIGCRRTESLRRVWGEAENIHHQLGDEVIFNRLQLISFAKAFFRHWIQCFVQFKRLEVRHNAQCQRAAVPFQQWAGITIRTDRPQAKPAGFDIIARHLFSGRESKIGF